MLPLLAVILRSDRYGTIRIVTITITVFKEQCTYKRSSKTGFDFDLLKFNTCQLLYIPLGVPEIEFKNVRTKKGSRKSCSIIT